MMSSRVSTLPGLVRNNRSNATFRDTVDEYIGSFPADVQRVLERVRRTIRKAIPGAAEVISYNMATFTVGGLTNGRRYYFRVAARNRVGVGPWSSAVSAIPATTPSEGVPLRVEVRW